MLELDPVKNLKWSHFLKVWGNLLGDIGPYGKVNILKGSKIKE